MKILLATIWHTGSNYVRLEYKRNKPDVIFQHTGHELWGKFSDADLQSRHIITTAQEPCIVGASWANRYNMNSPEYRWHWHCVWAGWERLMSYNPEIRWVKDFTGKVERSVGDPKGMKAFLKNKSMDEYYKLMPKDLILYAEEIYLRFINHPPAPEPSAPDTQDV